MNSPQACRCCCHAPLRAAWQHAVASAPEPLSQDQFSNCTSLTHAADAAQASDIRWASRWDTYLMMMDDQIHWFSIINSVMIVLFLSGMVAMIMMRTLHRDISKYNQLETAEEAQEETGWKLVSMSCWERAGVSVSLLKQRL